MTIIFRILPDGTDSALAEIYARLSSIGWASSGLYGVILFSLNIEAALVKSRPWARYPLGFLHMSGFFVSIIFDSLGFKIGLQGYLAAAYILLALIHRAFDELKKYECLPLMVH
jgi:hypothetical protein